MSGWTTRPLGDITTAVRRSAPIDKSAEYQLWSIPSFATGRPERLAGEAIGSAKLLVDSGDVLFSKINPRINRVWLVDAMPVETPRIASPEWAVLRIPPEDSSIDPSYLMHYLRSSTFRSWIPAATSSVTGSHARVKVGDLLRRPVSFPSLVEQRRIVAVLEDHLSRLDAADAYLAPTHARAESMRLATVQRLLAATPHQTTELGELLDVSIGGVWGSAPGEEAVDVAVLRVTELRPGGRLDESTAARRSISTGQLASRRLEVGDLLLEKSGGGPKQPIGRVGLVERVTQESVCANFMQLMRPDVRRAAPRFLHLYLNHLHRRGDTLSMQKASTNIRNIKASEYVRLPVPLPELTEQHSIVAEVATLDSDIERLTGAVEVSKRRSGRLRRALLTAAFTGRLTGRSSDMDIAEELAETTT